ncbi:MAG: hypothetical protein KBC84_10650 [Proteobacteria bacterium]|nr:hypothetical protein [Pseudomonadota bacterium]
MASITGALPNLLIILGLFFTYFFSFVLGLISGDFTGASTWKIIFLTPIILMALQSFIIWKYYPY